MQVIDELSRRAVDINKCVRAMVRHTPELKVYGYFHDTSNLKRIGIYNGSSFHWENAYVKDLELCYSNRGGFWFSKVGVPEDIIAQEVCTFGQGNFPYDFERRYEAIENFRIFEGKQVVLDPKKEYTLSKYLRYSFGLEFETSMGYVPEEYCFRDGLIPLRDGSIAGIEYSSVVLRGNSGLVLLEQEVNTLREHTAFNKECSLHMHFGGFPLDPQKLYNLYYLCKILEGEIASITPEYTFHTGQYKDNGKDYCNPLRTFRNFNQMYEYLVGRKFFGDLTQPHPNDIERHRKWQVHTR